MYCDGDLFIQWIPTIGSKQTSLTNLTDRIFLTRNINLILDLGSGIGDSVDYFRQKNPRAKWVGIDIKSSPEVEKRNRKDGNFITYDGEKLPFVDESFQLIYCQQVFEHVKKPRDLVQEIDRVLKRGGYFVGSTSHLEPYHSRSVFNFTPYGFTLLLEGTQLELVEMRPGIDVFTLLTIRVTKLLAKLVLGREPAILRLISRYYTIECPINWFLSLICKMLRKSDQEINFIKLLFCGHFVFLIQKNY